MRRRAAPPAGHHPLAHGRGRPRHRRPAHRWRLAARAGIRTPRLTRDIAAWNAGRSNGFLLIADDAVGGFFAINGGGLGADAGALYYWAPDTLEWEPLELSYTDFLRWALGGGLEEFYEGLRWPGWQADTQALAGDQGFSFYPFLWTREGSPSTSSRKAVDMAELYAMNAGQVGG